MNTQGKEGSFKLLFVIMLSSLAIAGLWDKIPSIKNSVHAILNPTAGVLFDWNVTWGMIVIIFILTLITTLFQKYATDQETLREMKKEQKAMSEEMKQYKGHPEKLMEFQKKQFQYIPKMMKLTMRPMIFTGIPLILFFRWFMDVFNTMGNPKFFGFFNWFWFYLVMSIIFSSILRKVLKVV